MIQKIINLFSCKSSCAFNQKEFNFDNLNMKLNNFKLKNKDIIKILKILEKTELIKKPDVIINDV